MDAYKSYTERVTQPSPTILGLRLLPFTLGHSMILKTAKSVFMVGGIEKLTHKELVGELVFALFVCSTTYDDLLNEVNSDKFKANLNTYAKELVAEVEQTQLFNLYSKVNTFAEYIKHGTSSPYYYLPSESESDVSICPVEVEQSMISTLMADCNYTRKECLDLPLTELLSAYLLYAHKQGTVSLKSRQEYELEQRLKGNK